MLCMRIRHLSFLWQFCLLALLLASGTAHAAAAMALGDTPRYPAGFQHFDYVNPKAPKGGRLLLPAMGSFDSLNPFTLKGDKASGLDLLVDTLMEKSLDEPFSMYGLLADDMSLAADGLSVRFHLHPQARFSDGSPVLAEDVKASFDTLTRDKTAHPRYRMYFADVKQVTVVDTHTVRFDFRRRNAELHMILGELPVFARRWLQGQPLASRILQPPLASGPYLLARYALGKYSVYQRRPDYWARELPSRRGQYNFDRIEFRYMLDDTVRLEAFKAGEFDVSVENVAKQWARGYSGRAFANGAIKKLEVPHGNGAGMQGFAMNLRRPLFTDQRVRQALVLAFDFDWANRQLFYRQYTRSDSYFSNSELAARGLPGADELALLNPLKDKLDPAVFGPAIDAPKSPDALSLRANLRQAQKLLADAGWRMGDDGWLINTAGQRLEFEFLTYTRTFERVAAPYQRNLEKLGVKLNVRMVDPALFQKRLEQFDFDMTVAGFPQSASPGNEQLDYFGSAAASQPGSNNLLGLQDPAVDALLQHFVTFRHRAELVAASRALDRVLRAGYYLMPNWHLAYHRIAYRDVFGRPERLPRYFQAQDWVERTWWAKPGARP